MKKLLSNPGLSEQEMAEFESLVKSNMKRAYFSALGIIGSHDAAMELSQEAFIRAYRHFKSFDRSKVFFTWYYKILRNLCLNFIRDMKKKGRLNSLEKIPLEICDDAVKTSEENDLKEKLEIALNQIEIEDREILILKEFENYSYKEISEALEIPIGTVMSRLYYARKRLAEKFERLTQ